MFQTDAIWSLSTQWSELTDSAVQERGHPNRAAKLRDFLHVIQDIRYGRSSSTASREQPPGLLACDKMTRGPSPGPGFSRMHGRFP